MAAITMESAPTGFDFSNHLRNAYLTSAAGPSKLSLPKATSTGTTIVGLMWEGGICLGADTRATEGPIVADKNCEKIHYISDNIRCCGAGTAADTEFVTAMISSNIQLHALSTSNQPRVVTAMTMLKQYLFQYQGHVGAALVLGGVDSTGPHLFTVAPHGSTDKLPYVTMGSGSLAAMAVFESKWRPKMQRQEAIELVVEAIYAGIFNDLGSGSNCDVCVIEKDHTEMLRNYKTPNERVQKELSYKMKRGATAVLRTSVKRFVVAEEVTHIGGGTAEGVAGSGAAAGDLMDVDSHSAVHAVDPTIETTYTSADGLIAVLASEKLSLLYTKSITDCLSGTDIRHILNVDGFSASRLLVTKAILPENVGLRVALLEFIKSRPFSHQILRDPNAPPPETQLLMAANPLSHEQDPTIEKTYVDIDALAVALIPYLLELMSKSSITSCLSGTDCLQIASAQDAWHGMQVLIKLACKPEKWRFRVELLKFVKSKQDLVHSIMINPLQEAPILSDEGAESQVQLVHRLSSVPRSTPQLQPSVDIPADVFQRRFEKQTDVTAPNSSTLA